jgi:hypothetical protein
MKTKICSTCKQEKPVDQFRRSYCFLCKKEHEKKYNHRRRKWNDEHKDKKIEYNKKYREKPGIKEKQQILTKQWKEKNKEHYKEYCIQYRKEYRKNKTKNDPLFKLEDNIRSSIYNAFKYKNISKSSKTREILGCSFEELKQHLESQFEPWMNWNNRGNHSVSGQKISWDIDHIVPLSSAKTEDDIVKLNHYTNLQPICSYYNRYIKRNKNI